MKKIVLAVAIAGMLGLGAAQAAGTKSTTFLVTATVANACLIDSASNLAFGTYVPGSGNHDASTSGGGVVVRCALGQNFQIALDGGQSASVTARAMKSVANSGASLAYQLYSDASGGTVWGNTTATDVDGTGTGLAVANKQTFPVYGRIFDTGSNLTAPDGTDYTDTINVTLTW